MPDLVEAIRSYNRGRDPELLPRKLAKMARDPSGFFRGSCHWFYATLPKRAQPRAAPRVWASGDLHLENAGSYRADNGQVYFDINDFDEAVLAPATWDLLRVLTSVLVARGRLALGAAEARRCARLLLARYAAALGEGNARWVERETALAPVLGLLNAAAESKARSLLKKRTTGKGPRRRLRADGDKALPASAEQRRKVESFFARYALHGEPRPSFQVLDVARRIAGTGSLGIERYVVLAARRGDETQPQLLDLKAALPPCAPSSASLPFAHDAERIVSIQRRMQAIPIAWLDAVEVHGAPFVLRRLLPSEDRIDLKDLRGRPTQLEALVCDIASCLAWAQLRSSGRQGSSNADALIGFGLDPSWQAPLLACAEQCAARVAKDHARFVRAFGTGWSGDHPGSAQPTRRPR